MQTAQGNLFTRDDTFFGVCQGLGEDLGISPNLLRVSLAVALFFNPVATVAGYAAMGLVVLGSRLLFPAPRRPVAETEVDEPAELALAA